MSAKKVEKTELGMTVEVDECSALAREYLIEKDKVELAKERCKDKEAELITMLKTKRRLFVIVEDTKIHLNSVPGKDVLKVKK
ncbi:MAG: hypothetical protein A2293_08040 [Elusimicrobia bacterium RIFOXYB2_FULL_49_7]|nr:MAG: hypothetical protein A2293_08040 [Elusimicrobia bacterium RIFOXYB2_FULL_49_7]